MKENLSLIFQRGIQKKAHQIHLNESNVFLLMFDKTFSIFQEYDAKRRENSTPENKTNWFRSLDRQPKHKNHEKLWTDTTDSK